jgi:hypothetical protein
MVGRSARGGALHDQFWGLSPDGNVNLVWGPFIRSPIESVIITKTKIDMETRPEVFEGKFPLPEEALVQAR